MVLDIWKNELPMMTELSDREINKRWNTSIVINNVIDASLI